MPRVSHIQELAQKCWDKIADEFPKINSQTGVIQFSIDQQLRFPDFKIKPANPTLTYNSNKNGRSFGFSRRSSCRCGGGAAPWKPQRRRSCAESLHAVRAAQGWQHGNPL